MLVATGVTGEITAHNQDVNNMAIRQLMRHDPYFMFGIKRIEQAVKAGRLTQVQVRSIMANALGVTMDRFLQDGPSYIDPELTIQRLALMLDAIDQAIAHGQTILLATGHPGSMLQFYLTLQDYIRPRHGHLYQLEASIPMPGHQWVDAVQSVIVISDLGSLLHDHGRQAIDTIMRDRPHIGLAVADHGMAGAAINAGIRTVALHDVDDPGIPVAAHLGADVIPVPMNDNQLNLRTNNALIALIEHRP